MSDGLLNGLVDDDGARQPTTKNALNRTHSYALTRFVEGLGQAEVGLLTRDKLAELATNNLHIEVTRYNIAGALKILGWKTFKRPARQKHAHERHVSGDGNRKTPFRKQITNQFYYMRKRLTDLETTVNGLRDVITELVEKLR